MAIDRTHFTIRKSPYFFACWLAVTLLQCIWLSPIPSVVITAAVAGGVVFAIQFCVPRRWNGAAFPLSLMVVIGPGLHFTSKLPYWSILMYFSFAFVVLAGFNLLLFIVEKTRRRA